MRFIELSRYLEDGQETYPGMPKIEITPFLTREECGMEFGKGGAALIDQVKMVNISGTYIDSPYLRFEDGYKIGDIPLQKLFNLPTFVIHMSDDHHYFDVCDFEILKDENLDGAAVLCQSGHDEKFGTPEYEDDVPYITARGAEWLMDRKVALVGIDTQIVDNFNEKQNDDYPGDVVHDEILGNLSVICEGMVNLGQLPDKGARLYVIPVRIAMASFTVRAFATVED